ncbi:facilitated trehalose transporter Tret1-2 homolog isoform X2 [Planococcus citri]|uniref:facilitated trehalose transporter Tret1-2 homolog isoform X2 n=1 Tax=Planococcus citri TaxID=170843 RepID=UPI0031F7532C
MVVISTNVPRDFNVIFAASVASFSATAATCVLSWINPTLPIITKPGSKILVTDEQGAWIGSLPALGAAFGPFLTGRIVDRFGRKWTIIWVMVLLILSWGVMYFSDNMMVLYCSRFVAGVGVGCVYATLPMYVAEMAPCELRGMLCSLLQFFDCIGYLIEYIVGAYVSYENLIVVSAAMPLLCIFTILWIPESPYHLHNKGKEAEALQALQYFRGYADVSTLQREIADMEASARNMEVNKGSFTALFTNKGNLKCLYYSATLIFFQQMSGINIITFYSATIFEESGSSFDANWCAIIVAIVMTFTSILTLIGAKIFRIKYLYAFSAVGEMFSMAALGTYFFLDESIAKSLDWLPLTSLVLFIFAYTSGFGPLVWVTTSEIFPSHLKALGCGLNASFCWLLSFFLTRYFVPFTKTFGQGVAFWGFGVFCVFALVFVIFQLPDTHRMTFQEIQELIQGNKDEKSITKKQGKSEVAA